MSYSSPEFSRTGDRFASRQRKNGDTVADDRWPTPADTAIDAALRSVPLPNGLLPRLSIMIAALPDGPPDQLDWLGC